MPEFWTSRAWTDSHSDFFTRNILTFDTMWDSAEARAYNEFTPNNARPTWPTIDEAQRWAQSINSYPGIAGGAGSVNVENLQLCLDAAIERFSTRTHIQVRPVDSAGAVDLLGDPVEIPATVKLATIKQAVRWARRAMTPDGIAGASEIGGLIRTSSIDPDIEAEVGYWLHIGLA